MSNNVTARESFESALVDATSDCLHAVIVAADAIGLDRDEAVAVASMMIRRTVETSSFKNYDVGNTSAFDVGDNKDCCHEFNAGLYYRSVLDDHNNYAHMSGQGDMRRSSKWKRTSVDDIYDEYKVQCPECGYIRYICDRTEYVYALLDNSNFCERCGARLEGLYDY